MVAKAVARYIRISPRKTRLVANYIKGKKVGEALALLTNLNRRACEFMEDVLRSAISNAKRNPDINEDELYISKLNVDTGPMLKRYRAASMGRAMRVTHRTSHISVELDVAPKPKPKIPGKGEKKTVGKKIKGRMFKRKTPRSK